MQAGGCTGCMQRCSRRQSSRRPMDRANRPAARHQPALDTTLDWQMSTWSGQAHAAAGGAGCRPAHWVRKGSGTGTVEHPAARQPAHCPPLPERCAAPLTASVIPQDSVWLNAFAPAVAVIPITPASGTGVVAMGHQSSKGGRGGRTLGYSCTAGTRLILTTTPVVPQTVLLAPSCDCRRRTRDRHARATRRKGHASMWVKGRARTHAAPANPPASRRGQHQDPTARGSSGGKGAERVHGKAGRPGVGGWVVSQSQRQRCCFHPCSLAACNRCG